MPTRDERFPQYDYDQLSLYQHNRYGLYCLSEWDIAVIMSSLRTADWSARWRGSNEKLLRDVGREADLDQALAQVADISWRLNMSLCDDLTTAINNLAQVTSQGQGNGGCGCGTIGQASDDPPIALTTGSIHDATQTPPTGYADWPEYQTAKCDVAADIIVKFIQDWNWLSTQNIIALTAASLGLALATPIPGDELVAFLAVLVAIVGIQQGWIDNAADAMQDNANEYHCILYEATSAENARSEFLTAFGANVDLEVADPVGRSLIKYAQDIMSRFVNFNDLFDQNAVRESQALTADCSGCENCQDTIEFGTGVINGTVNSAFDGVNHRLQFYLGAASTITVNSISGHQTAGGSNNDFRATSYRSDECGDTFSTWDLYDSDTDPTSQVWVGAGRVSFVGSVPFSADFTVS